MESLRGFNNGIRLSTHFLTVAMAILLAAKVPLARAQSLPAVGGQLKFAPTAEKTARLTALCSALEDMENRAGAQSALEAEFPNLAKDVVTLAVDGNSEARARAAQAIAAQGSHARGAAPVLVRRISLDFAAYKLAFMAARGKLATGENPLVVGVDLARHSEGLREELKAAARVAPENAELAAMTMQAAEMGDETGHQTVDAMERVSRVAVAMLPAYGSRIPEVQGRILAGLGELARAGGMINRVAAVEAMGEIGLRSSRARRAIVKILKLRLGEKVTAAAAITALGRCGVEAQGEVVTFQRLKMDPEEDVRNAAGAAVIEIGLRSAAAVGIQDQGNLEKLLALAMTTDLVRRQEVLAVLRDVDGELAEYTQVSIDVALAGRERAKVDPYQMGVAPGMPNALYKELLHELTTMTLTKHPELASVVTGLSVHEADIPAPAGRPGLGRNWQQYLEQLRNLSEVHQALLGAMVIAAGERVETQKYLKEYCTSLLKVPDGEALEETTFDAMRRADDVGPYWPGGLLVHGTRDAASNLAFLEGERKRLATAYKPYAKEAEAIAKRLDSVIRSEIDLARQNTEVRAAVWKGLMEMTRLETMTGKRVPDLAMVRAGLKELEAGGELGKDLARKVDGDWNEKSSDGLEDPKHWRFDADGRVQFGTEAGTWSFDEKSAVLTVTTRGYEQKGKIRWQDGEHWVWDRRTTFSNPPIAPLDAKVTFQKASALSNQLAPARGNRRSR